jgi:hypothetical protein
MGNSDSLRSCLIRTRAVTSLFQTTLRMDAERVLAKLRKLKAEVATGDSRWIRSMLPQVESGIESIVGHLAEDKRLPAGFGRRLDNLESTADLHLAKIEKRRAKSPREPAPRRTPLAG